MSNKKYSVLMSIYKGENKEYFIQSIESMLNQSLMPEEIVIVKDGKLTRELEEVIFDYQGLYNNLFTIVSLNQNVGLGLALNKGLQVCRNELVARMDTDDISLPERCELQVREFEKNPSLCIVGTDIDEFIDNPKNVVSSRVVPKEHNKILEFSKRRNPFNHPTVMYKKNSVLKMGGYGDYRRNQDLELFVRMLNNGCKSANIGKSLLLFRANKDNFKRRKSWTKCSSYIHMIYSFWRKGYSSPVDLILVATSQIVIFVSPLFIIEWVSDRFLRENVSRNK